MKRKCRKNYYKNYKSSAAGFILSSQIYKNIFHLDYASTDVILIYHVMHVLEIRKDDRSRQPNAVYIANYCVLIIIMFLTLLKKPQKRHLFYFALLCYFILCYVLYSCRLVLLDAYTRLVFVRVNISEVSCWFYTITHLQLNTPANYYYLLEDCFRIFNLTKLLIRIYSCTKSHSSLDFYLNSFIKLR